MIALCNDCGSALNSGSNFCTSCGASVRATTSGYGKMSFDVKLVLAYYFILLAFILILGAWFGDSYDYYTEIMSTIFFVAISSIFIIRYQDQLQPYLKNPPTVSVTGTIIIFAVTMAVIVNLIADSLNHFLFNGSYSEIELYLSTDLPFLNAVFFVCVIPAIFEELAFRGFMYRTLKDAYNEETSYILTSVLFAILHLSLIGLLWYIPLGLAFGYIRRKYNSLVYCMIAHFVYNFTIVLLEFYVLDL